MGHQDRTQDIKAGRLLELIREKPTLYLGENSLTGLWHFCVDIEWQRAIMALTM